MLSKWPTLRPKSEFEGMRVNVVHGYLAMTVDQATKLMGENESVLYPDDFGEWSKQYRSLPFATSVEGALIKGMMSKVYNPADGWGRTTWVVVHVILNAELVTVLFNAGKIRKTSVPGFEPGTWVDGWRYHDRMDLTRDVTEFDLIKARCFLNGRLDPAPGGMERMINIAMEALTNGQ